MTNDYSRMTIKFGLIGGGVMGEALLSRLIAQGIYQASEIIVSEPQVLSPEFFTSAIQCRGDSR